jgi:hypothetical protein
MLRQQCACRIITIATHQFIESCDPAISTAAFGLARRLNCEPTKAPTHAAAAAHRAAASLTGATAEQE